jgi:soluble lytic murein transglycosylase-like protein
MTVDPRTLEHLRSSVWPTLEQSFGLPKGILDAVATWETRGAFQANAFNPNSGARGIFQLTPIALRQVQQDIGLSADPFNPYAASAAAAALLARYSRLFQGQPTLMLAAYNAGEGTIRQFLRDIRNRGRGFLPLETREYIANVVPMLR